MNLRPSLRAAIAVAAVATVLVGIDARPGRGTTPGTAGKIAFELNYGVAVVEPDGTGLTPLTFNPCGSCSPFPDRDQWPAWSPDGGKIAFMHFHFDERFQVYGISVMNADGTGLHALTNPCCTGSDNADTQPRWSPDGTKIVFVRNGDIAVADAGGESPAQPVSLLTTGGADSAPDWSPDGGRIVFSRSGRIFVMYADGAGQAPVTGGPSDFGPRWSPDGASIAFERTGQIFVAGADGSGEHVLTAGSAPSWSPDGTRIAFSENGQIAVVGIDGSGRTAITAGERPDWGARRAAEPPPPPTPSPPPPTPTPRLPDLKLSVRGAASVRLGRRASFAVRISNVGAATAPATVLRDALGRGLRFSRASRAMKCSGTRTVVCAIGPIAPGQTLTRTIVVLAVRPGRQHQLLQVTSGQPDAQRGDNVVRVRTFVRRR